MSYSQLGPQRENEQFGHSLQNIIGSLQTQSTREEIMLARFFTCLMTFERRADRLKNQLFEQPEVSADNFMQLFNTLFKAVDRSLSLKVTVDDLKAFMDQHCEVGEKTKHLPILVNFFAGRAAQKLTNERPQQHTWLTFADFLMIITPRRQFKLKLQTLFKNSFPVYDLERSVQTSNRSKNLMAQIFELWLQLIDELQHFTINPRLQDWLFERIRGKTFTASDLFSFVLNLPVIFSTQDCDYIFDALKTDKASMLVGKEDFDLVFSLTRPPPYISNEDKENCSWPGHQRKKTPYYNDQEEQDTLKESFVSETFKSTEGRKRRSDSSMYAETSRDGTLCKVSPDRRRLSQTQVISQLTPPRSPAQYQESSVGTPKHPHTISSNNTRGSKPQLKPKVWAHSNTKSTLQQSPPQIRGNSACQTPPKDGDLTPYNHLVEDSHRSRNMSQVSSRGRTEVPPLPKVISADTQSRDSGKAPTAYSSNHGAPKHLKIYRIKREKKDSKSLQSLPRSEDRPDTPPSRLSRKSLEQEQNRRLRNCLQTFDKYKKAVTKYGLQKQDDKRKCCTQKQTQQPTVATIASRQKSREHTKSLERLKSKERQGKCSIKKIQNQKMPPMKRFKDLNEVQVQNNNLKKKQVSKQELKSFKAAMLVKKSSGRQLRTCKSGALGLASKKRLIHLSPSRDIESPSMSRKKVIKASQRTKSASGLKRYENQTANSAHRQQFNQRVNVGAHSISHQEPQIMSQSQRQQQWVDVTSQQPTMHRSFLSDRPNPAQQRRYTGTYGASSVKGSNAKSTTSRDTATKKKQLSRIQSSFTQLEHELKSLKQVLKQNGIKM